MKKMTNWFPSETKPVRVGVYQVDWHVPDPFDRPWYAYWDGALWGFMDLSAPFAEHDYKRNKLNRHEAMVWRGFTEEQK